MTSTPYGSGPLPDPESGGGRVPEERDWNEGQRTTRRAALLTAAGFGLADARIATVAHPIGGASPDELETRAALYYENYYITVMIEARCLSDMLLTMLIP